MVVGLVVVVHGVVLWWVVVGVWWVVVVVVEEVVVVQGVDHEWCSSTGRTKFSPRATTPARAGLAARATRAMEGIISRD